MTLESKKTQDPMTLDKLAEMIAKGFEQTATKVELKAVEFRLDKKIDEGLNRVELRLEKVEDRLSIVETKLDKALYKEIVRIEDRVKKLETKKSGT